jgi:D-beta-D-heptose 7-phosphate kinase/D-beta-D-heptose 1-phosphate adenosyltransferase
VSFSRRQILERVGSVRALVAGDLMLDEYLFGDVQRISPDAPVPVVALGQRRYNLGGASNVAANLVALGVKTTLVGAVGDDDDGARLKVLANEKAIDSRLVVTRDRPTTRKTRVVARNQHVIRLDSELAAPLAPPVGRELLDAIVSGEPPDLIILSDYAKGVITRELTHQVMAWAAARDIPVVVDPKLADFTAYRGARYLTPNAKEAQLAARQPTQTREEAVAACRKLLEETGARAILLTRGELGMALIDQREAHFVAAHKRSVFDVTGAGDTVIAAFAACVAAGGAPVEAMALANWAAGIVVGRLGAATCTRDEIAREAGIDFVEEGAEPGDDPRLHSPRIATREQAQKTLERWRQEGRRIVFTNGCFDLLHAGHVVLLEEARARGDVLVVGLNTDASVQRLKGPERPVQPLRDRARVLAALHSVDLVVPFDEDTPLETIVALQPDVLVKGGDYVHATIVGAREVTGWGGEVAVVQLLPKRSTTAILERV